MNELNTMHDDNIKHNILMQIAYNESLNSDHPSFKYVGCILVDNDDILSYGHNKMLIKCCDDNLLNERKPRTHLMCHAEEMCLAQNSKKITETTVLYITALPCSTCARYIILSGIKNIVCYNKIIGSQWKESCDYSLQLFKSNNINIVYIDNMFIHNGVCYCLNCNIFMGDNNPRQLCGKTHCKYDDKWYYYDNNNVIIINTDIINEKKRKQTSFDDNDNKNCKKKICK
jgi:deoxycytidylate deaminase